MRGTGFTVGVVFLALGVSACATTAKGNTRDSGAWREVSSEHFAVRTNLALEEARAADQYLEATRAALLALFGPHADRPLPEPTAVTVFANEVEFHRYFPHQVGGLYARTSYPDHVFLFGNPSSWDSRKEIISEGHGSVVKHEMSHAISAGVFLRQPRWFNEGLAQYLETFEIAPDQRTVTFGAANLQALAMYHRFRGVDVAQLFEWGGRKLDDQTDAQFVGDYGLAWALVHYLINTHLPQVAALEDAYASGAKPEEAWKQIMNGVTPEALDIALTSYVKHGDYRLFTLPLELKMGEVRDRKLTHAEVELTYAEAALRGASMSAENREAKSAEAKANLEDVLRTDPDNVRALSLQPYASKADALAAARRAVAQHPEDVQAWAFLSYHAEDRAERVKALQEGLRLAPNEPNLLNNLAWDEAGHGQAREAVAKAERAVRLVPWDWAFVDTLAHAYAAAGRCEEANRAEARALDLFPEHAPRQARRNAENAAEALKTRCRP